MPHLFTKSGTLIVFALKVEAQGLFDDLHKVYSGVGKVNAAFHLTRELMSWQHKHGSQPSLVLNLGSAGSSHFKAGTLVNCTQFIQRDMDTTALGTEAYATPFDDGPLMLTNGLRIKGHAEGACGSGDNFVTDGKVGPWNVVDMEAYALAKVCSLENVPFGCVKFITDGADGHAAATWETALADAARGLRHALEVILSGP